ncbi:hypothetical protein COT29_03065 [Candidatus Micrarchaeota archaeon CG08_land_8_20_14_0_20_59_11]|nr:MAG: hypothetical protein COT29_03065 [Candidatus Micrarchaeota archaeon CG08_land_8_20_14_0_20_59_11]
MKITKQKIIMGFTVFIILAFVLEAFVVVMWKPVEQATPTPSPQAQEFEGSGTVNATIGTLGGTLFVSCNTTEDVSGLLNAVPGISRAVAAGETSYILMLSNSSAGVADSIAEKLADKCEATILRSSKLEFKETLTATEFPPGNATKVLAPKDLNYLQSVYPPYVDARHAEGDDVTMTVILQITAEGLRVVMEEKRGAAPQPTVYEGGGFGVARIAQLEDALWVRCNATNATALLAGIRGVNATDAVEENRSYNVAADAGANVSALAEKISETLADACDVRIMRYAMLGFTDDVSIASESNETRAVPKAKLEGAYGLVKLERAVNETILASVMIRMLGDEIVGTAIQDAG